jgi:hypothetical protein
MDIYSHSAKEVEDFVKDQAFELSAMFDLDIAVITRNPDQGGRKRIYDLGLSDGSTVVLKICSNSGIRREIEGMRYASTTEISSPKLLGYEINEDNPLKNPFLLMEHVPRQPIVDYGDYEINLWGRVVTVNYEKVKDRIDNILEVIPKLNKKCERQSPIDIFEKYTVFIESNDDLYLKFQELRRFYEKNYQLLQRGLEYHLHGDLDSTNIVTTQKGLIFVDWGHYSKGDVAEELAYFAIRNFWVDFDEYAGKLVELISKKDKTFAKRFGFHLSMSKLWHVVYKSLPKEFFLEAPLFC